MKDYGKGDDGKNDENENDAFSRFFPCLRFPLNELYNQNEMLSGGGKKSSIIFQFKKENFFFIYSRDFNRLCAISYLAFSFRVDSVGGNFFE